MKLRVDCGVENWTLPKSMREIAKALAEISPNGQEEGTKQSLLPKLRSRLATNRAG